MTGSLEYPFVLPPSSAGACPSPADFEAYLIEDLRRPVKVYFGRSRTVPVRSKENPANGVLELRLHRAFGEAPDEICEALVRWLRAGRRARRASALLDAWIEKRMGLEPARQPKQPTLQPQGEVYDLNTLAKAVIEEHFPGDFGADRTLPKLTWGRRGRSRSRHSLRLGSYDPLTHVVRVHPVLDQAKVPSWFVSYVLMHELLHAVFPPRRASAQRWVHHGPDFNAREQAHPDYARAQSWEKKNLAALIRSARSTKPFKPRLL